MFWQHSAWKSFNNEYDCMNYPPLKSRHSPKKTTQPESYAALCGLLTNKLLTPKILRMQQRGVPILSMPKSDTPNFKD